MDGLTVKGSQNFMGTEIPVVLGGFGSDKWKGASRCGDLGKGFGTGVQERFYFSSPAGNVSRISIKRSNWNKFKMITSNFYRETNISTL